LWWEPGTKTGYHAYTFGYLAGEIVPPDALAVLQRVLHDGLAAPLGFADEIFFGMPVRKRGSLATLVDAPSEVDWSVMQIPEDLPMFRAAPMSLFPPPRRLLLGPGPSDVHPRVLAAMAQPLVGHLDLTRLTSELLQLDGQLLDQVPLLGEDQDLEVFGNEARWGLGYAIAGPSG
jgi:hypothetical protein